MSRRRVGRLRHWRPRPRHWRHPRREGSEGLCEPRAGGPEGRSRASGDEEEGGAEVSGARSQGGAEAHDGLINRELLSREGSKLCNSCRVHFSP